MLIYIRVADIQVTSQTCIIPVLCKYRSIVSMDCSYLVSCRTGAGCRAVVSVAIEKAIKNIQTQQFLKVNVTKFYLLHQALLASWEGVATGVECSDPPSHQIALHLW